MFSVLVLLNPHGNFMKYCHILGNKGTERFSNFPKVTEHQCWDSNPGSHIPETRFFNAMSCCCSTSNKYIIYKPREGQWAKIIREI